jgi:hypothetical protein
VLQGGKGILIWNTQVDERMVLGLDHRIRDYTLWYILFDLQDALSHGFSETDHKT